MSMTFCLPLTGLLGTLLTLTVQHILLNFPLIQSFHLLKRQANSLSWRTVLDKHSLPSLQKAMTHSSFPWLESIRHELYIAKREGRQAERKWRKTKLAIFKDLYKQAKHKAPKRVHTAKCKFYTEGIALAFSSNELHQIVHTLSNRHPPKILPSI